MKKQFPQNKDKQQKNKSSKEFKETVKPLIPIPVQVKNELRKPPKLFYMVLVLLPFLLLFILELSLRVFNYGIDNNQWVQVTDNLLAINPDIARRYFYNTKDIPSTIQDAFDKVKKPNAFRVFVLGESSAAGYPFMPIGSFSRYLQKRLELVYPDSKIEIINIAMTAINSFTMRDLLPGVFDQKPDLIIIYAGHNEYYGALGIGSNESLGNSRFLINTDLYFGRYKTFELIRNLIKSVSGIFHSNSQENAKGTLMSRIVKDQYITYNSDEYQAGINQFEGNFKDILEMAKAKGVPVILGTVACNLKDRHPFVSVKNNNAQSADEVFNQAKELLAEGNTKNAAMLFRKAKDLDALRFRAPEEINRVIIKLGKEFGAGVIKIDSVLNAVSPDGIVGDNLMTDHLHPTLEGYQLIGKLYYEKMEQLKILPKAKKINDSNKFQDSLALAKFNFSKLDSTIADFRIKYLKNDWPFVEKGNMKHPYQLFSLKNIIDSVAVQVLDGTLDWGRAQKYMAAWYLRHNDINSYERQMNVLISEYPFIVEYYDLTARELLKLKKFDDAYGFLLRRYAIKPDAFSSKWLGIIDLSKGRTDSAVKFLEESIKYSYNDSQALYNLSGAYLYKKQYDKALTTINICLSYDPEFAGAKQMQKQLSAIVRK